MARLNLRRRNAALLAAAGVLCAASAELPLSERPECFREEFLARDCREGSEHNLYDAGLTIEEIHEDGEVFNTSNFAGQVLLILNVASYWGFTPQYYSLNDLSALFQGRPLTILAFPCNQFSLQEPGANATEILMGMKYVRPGTQRGEPYEPDFPMTRKIDVNGANAHPIFRHLKRACPPPCQTFKPSHKLYYSPMHTDDVRWNFEKYLINHHGRPIRRYISNTEPMDMVDHIETLVAAAEAEAAGAAAAVDFRSLDEAGAWPDSTTKDEAASEPEAEAEAEAEAAYAEDGDELSARESSPRFISQE